MIESIRKKAEANLLSRFVPQDAIQREYDAIIEASVLTDEDMKVLAKEIVDLAHRERVNVSVGLKIQCIKLLRLATKGRLALKEAKDLIDATGI